ncbi:MAG TPA: hypothetical protein VKA46_42430 [Gemmataceae bacterium]|nr:hypothetical protein [Gemmataceae bacterium]
MTPACRKCHRINPPVAAYCYFDGVSLAGQAEAAAAAPPGTHTFPMPFTFPSGRACHNYNELALACVDDWSAALAVLHKGHLERFLGGVGRVDLAEAAREAARFPDPDRGLDQLLDRLPGDALTPPKLVVKTTAFDLGPLAVGSERRLVLTLVNGGMRLLYGSIAVVDAPWLTFGPASPRGEKVFQFGDRMDVPIEVAGHRLRAGLKPLEGQIVVQSNGGTATVLVRAAVPTTPFPVGVLQGALTPRQMAEKAKAAPKAAAAFFENGAVADWYRSNGWTYPVRGPVASGLGAVQQFFEALCLTKAPKVTLSEPGLELQGRPGEALSHTLCAQAEENRPIFASAVSDRLWLTVGPVRLKGRFALIPLLVLSIPNSPGETLTARVTVEANGNQRFVVPVTLAIGGRRSRRRTDEEDDFPMVLPADEDDVLTVLPADEPTTDPPPPAEKDDDEAPRDGSDGTRRKRGSRRWASRGGEGFP